MLEFCTVVVLFITLFTNTKHPIEYNIMSDGICIYTSFSLSDILCAFNNLLNDSITVGSSTILWALELW